MSDDLWSQVNNAGSGVGINNIDADIGNPADPPASTDNATASLIALTKRSLAHQSSIESKTPPLVAGRVPTTDSDLGARADSTATDDNGTFSLISLFKRALGKLTDIAGKLPTLSGGASPVVGPATNAELRATPLPVSLNSFSGLTDTQLRASSISVTFASAPLPAGAATETTLAAVNAKLPALSGGLVPVTLGLTNAELRASAVPVSAASLPLPAGAATNAALTAIDAKLPTLVGGLTPVVGPLTDAELRSAPVPTSVASLPLPSGASTAALQTTGNASLSAIDAKLPALSSGSVPVIGPLTDTQLRASAVPVSAAALPLPAGAATAAKQDVSNTSLASIDAKAPALVSGSVPVIGPLTDTQLRAAPVPTSVASLPLPSGAATAALQTTANSSLAAIDGKLPTLSGGSVPVIGPLTDAQMRASPVPVSATALPLPSGAATEATLNAIKSALQNAADIAATQWTDDSGAFYIRRDLVDTDTGVITTAFTTPTGAVATPGTGLRPASTGDDIQEVTAGYMATASGTGYSTGDLLYLMAVLDIGVAPPTLRSSAWLNVTTQAIIAAPPSNHIALNGSGGATQAVTVSSGSIAVSNFPATQAVSAVALPLPSGAATSASQATGNASLASIDGKLPALSSGAVPVTGALTDTQLRASPVPMSATALPLPAGASTAALQTTGNTSLAAIDGKLPALSGGSVPVVGPLTDTQLRASPVGVSAVSLPLPSGAATSASQATANASLASIDAKAPALVSGSVPVIGPLTNTELRATAVPVSASALPLPSGASTSALQTTGNTSLAAIDGKLPALVSGAVPVTGPVTDAQMRATPIPMSVASLPLPTGGATSALQTTSNTSLASIDGKLPALSAGQVPVVGPLTDTQLRASAVPIAAAALPLPAGAATGALQTTGNTSLASIDAKIPALVSGAAPVRISSRTRQIASSTVSASGNVAAGAVAIYVKNTGLAVGSFAGAVIEPGDERGYSLDNGDEFGAIAYDGTGTSLFVERVF